VRLDVKLVLMKIVANLFFLNNKTDVFCVKKSQKIMFIFIILTLLNRAPCL